MHSFLLISSDKQSLHNYKEQFCKERGVAVFDQIVVTSEKALGIADVRAMQKTIFLKPLKSKQKIVIIENADTATIETQNALLKLLEEPPAHTIMMLTAATDKSFLPTILSRCSIIRLEENNQPSTESLEKTKKEVQQLLSASIGTKLYLAQNVAAKKEEAIEWLKQMLYATRALLLEQIENADEKITYMQIIEQLQKAHTMITTTNVNSRFLLEQTFLKI